MDAGASGSGVLSFFVYSGIICATIISVKRYLKT